MYLTKNIMSLKEKIRLQERQYIHQLTNELIILEQAMNFRKVSLFHKFV